ncbi:MAG: hypothetical protein QM682_02870 [Paracoccus sp. (in: a-proteobacteria)]|uniref:alpha/beta hydrolase family protein n=1 Tax=Paracoccus sp. TaxID=267 RepID=UPI0039E26C52
MACLAETAAGIMYRSGAFEKGRPLKLSIWYPSDEQASAIVGGNPVFEGVSAAPNARLPEGPLPLVVVSHGGLRSAADSGAWLSSSIAQKGFIVVEVNAPRPESAAVALDEIWRRPQDISRAIDLVLADAELGKRIEESRISVAGFALGATAALSVAGARMDAERYAQFCAGDGGSEGPDCDWYAAQGVGLTQSNRQRLTGLARDPRITFAIAVDPEYPAALGAANADVATLRISLGGRNDSFGTGPSAQTVVMRKAIAFDAFGACTEAGPSILLEEDGDASICGGSAEARKSIHQEISDEITSFLARGAGGYRRQ